MKDIPRSRCRLWAVPRGWSRVGNRLLLSFLLCLVAAGIAACASKKAEQPPSRPIVWPAPPDEPRVAYVKSIKTPADLGFKTSRLSRFGNWLIGTRQGESVFVKPFGIALDEADNLCVTDTGANAVYFFDLAQNRSRRWTSIEKLRFVSPVGIAKRGDSIFVADSSLGLVIAFNTDGKLLFQIKEGLSRPSGVAVSDENLFVIDSQSNRVAVFDLRGKLLRQFGERGAGPGQFNFPTHIAVTRGGDLLVTDSLNGRIQMFDLQGNYKGQIGSAGDSSGHFGRPKGAAMDSYGRVYAVDALFDNIQIFEKSGTFLLTVGQSGRDRGEFWMPNGLAITRDNLIYVADSYNRRIQVLKYIGGER